MKLAIKTAKNDPDKWRDKSIEERQKILMDVAHEVRKSRADLIGIAAAEV
jgi:RHH-type proline utilization regulon transcriptional repressor/proline dehydrogenase/delta 1-pyrroline-5-carboxylate dehydrogenase